MTPRLDHARVAPDELFARTRDVLGEKDLAEPALAVVTSNAWNRLSIVARLVPTAGPSAEVNA